MSPDQALALLRRVVEGVSLAYADHQTIQQALAVLQQTVASTSGAAILREAAEE